MTTDKQIVWVVSEDWNRVVLATCSIYAMPEDTEIIVKHEDLYKTMERLADKYNNFPDGYVTVLFEVG